MKNNYNYNIIIKNKIKIIAIIADRSRWSMIWAMQFEDDPTCLVICIQNYIDLIKWIYKYIYHGAGRLDVI